jgi:hypothetical protein
MSITQQDVAQGLAQRRQVCAEFQEDLDKAEKTWETALGELRTKGFTVFKGYMPREKALAIGAAFNEYCRDGVNLQSPRDVSKITDPKVWQTAERISAEDMRKGEDWLREHTNILQVDEPLVRFADLARLGLDPNILDIAGAYLGALPMLGFVKARKSLVNKLPRYTELYHIDGNSRSMVKAFLCLNDIGRDTGAHEFVEGTHTTTGDRDEMARWTYDEMVEMFGADRIRYHTGSAGDVILEDTTGFHSAGKPTKTDRLLVIFNYVLHPEYGYEAADRPRVKITKDFYDGLNAKQRAAAVELAVT